MIISKPISRASFISGKILGLTSILFLSILIISIFALYPYITISGKIDSLMIFALFNTLIEALILLLLVVLFSIITNNVLSIVYTLSMAMLSYGISLLSDSKVFTTDNLLQDVLISFFLLFIPNLEAINLRPFLIYQQDVSSEMIFNTATYGLAYCGVVFLLILFVFSRKELD